MRDRGRTTIWCRKFNEAPGAMLSRPVPRSKLLPPTYWGRESMLTEADKFQQRIHDQGHVLFPRIKPGTRPRPIRGMIHEAAADRIVVKVIDHRAKRGRFLDVAIISAASLPETMVHFAVRLYILEPLEKAWRPPS